MPTHHSKYGIALQDRDTALMRGLYESRIMTRKHIAALYFDGKEEAAKKRTQKLVRAKLIAERARQPYEPAVLHLAKSGYDALVVAGLLNNYPSQTWKSFQKRVQVSDRTIAHELLVMDIRASVAEAVREQSDLELVEFSTWPKLYEFRAKKPVVTSGITRQQEVLMKPDGFIRIHERDDEGVAEHAFFLELDRSTESLRQLVSKAVGYRDYYKRGGYAERCGLDPRIPAACPFRVLVIVLSEARKVNLRTELLHLTPPIKSQVLIYSHSKFEQDPLRFIEG